ncbi:MAG: CCA tRNA nucleotidyltransferase [Clostridia bacterium]|nr:CCA tRNA nucleotidyltransferase [Clostridia bacterium]
MPDNGIISGIAGDGRLRRITSRLADAGYNVYFVGGCVRDHIMGAEPHDYDVATDAAPEEVLDVFGRDGGFKVIETGLKHGTVTVVCDHLHVEITTFRSETGYSDHRRPDGVFFGKDIDADLARRDFTVNAIALDAVDGSIVDPHGGIADIENRLIRCVGDPAERFGEDALRILRALRFSSKLGFDIEDKTSEALVSMRGLLSYISAERKYSELKQILCGKNAEQIIIGYPLVLAELVPEIADMIGFDQKNRHHVYDLLTHTAKVVSGVPAEKPYLRLAALLHDTGKPPCCIEKDGERHFPGHADISEEISRRVLRSLRADKWTAERVCKLVKYHDVNFHGSERGVKRFLGAHGADLFDDLLILKRADNAAQSPAYPRNEEFDRLESVKEKTLAEKQCVSIADLAVNGKDMLALGYEGKEIGDILAVLLALVIDGELENEREALVGYAKSYTDSADSV